MEIARQLFLKHANTIYCKIYQTAHIQILDRWHHHQHLYFMKQVNPSLQLFSFYI